MEFMNIPMGLKEDNYWEEASGGGDSDYTFPVQSDLYEPLMGRQNTVSDSMNNVDMFVNEYMFVSGQVQVQQSQPSQGQYSQSFHGFYEQQTQHQPQPAYVQAFPYGRQSQTQQFVQQPGQLQPGLLQPEQLQTGLLPVIQQSPIEDSLGAHVLMNSESDMSNHSSPFQSPYNRYWRSGSMAEGIGEVQNGESPSIGVSHLPQPVQSDPVQSVSAPVQALHSTQNLSTFRSYPQAEYIPYQESDYSNLIQSQGQVQLQGQSQIQIPQSQPQPQIQQSNQQSQQSGTHPHYYTNLEAPSPPILEAPPVAPVPQGSPVPPVPPVPTFSDLTAMVNNNTEMTFPMIQAQYIDRTVCNVCGKKVTRDMVRHLRTHHSEPRFKCKFTKCQLSHKAQKFNRPYDFKKHLLNRHFKFDNPEVRKQINLSQKLHRWGACQCGQRFLSDEWLDNHVLGESVCEDIGQYEM